MLRYKHLSPTTCCIIEDGIVYEFDTMGMQSGTHEVTPRDLDGMLDLPIVSILCDGAKAQLFIYKGKDQPFIQSKCKKPVVSVISQAMSTKIVRALSRKGTQDGHTYMQQIYVYPEGTDVSSLMGGA